MTDDEIRRIATAHGLAVKTISRDITGALLEVECHTERVVSEGERAERKLYNTLDFLKLTEIAGAFDTPFIEFTARSVRGESYLILRITWM